MKPSTDGLAAHTPGPWRFRAGDDVIPPVVQRGDEGGFMVKGLSPEREAADARLIAAAPELLAALEDILAAADADCLRDDAADGRNFKESRQIAATRSAIAKARGQ